MKQKFKWKTPKVAGLPLEDMEWGKTLLNRESTIPNEIDHFAQKAGLIKHKWQRNVQAANEKREFNKASKNVAPCPKKRSARYPLLYSSSSSRSVDMFSGDEGYDFVS